MKSKLINYESFNDFNSDNEMEANAVKRVEIRKAIDELNRIDHEILLAGYDNKKMIDLYSDYKERFRG